jgi:hypothetical protein
LPPSQLATLAIKALYLLAEAACADHEHVLQDPITEAR